MNRRQRTSLRAEQKLVDDWNSKHTIGQRVRYWRGVREGTGVESVTRTDAQLLSGHTAVVWIEGCSGCIGLTHVEAIVEPAPVQA